MKKGKCELSEGGKENERGRGESVRKGGRKIE